MDSRATPDEIDMPAVVPPETIDEVVESLEPAQPVDPIVCPPTHQPLESYAAAGKFPVLTTPASRPRKNKRLFFRHFGTCRP